LEGGGGREEEVAAQQLPTLHLCASLSETDRDAQDPFVIY